MAFALNSIVKTWDPSHPRGIGRTCLEAFEVLDPGPDLPSLAYMNTNFIGGPIYDHNTLVFIAKIPKVRARPSKFRNPSCQTRSVVYDSRDRPGPNRNHDTDAVTTLTPTLLADKPTPWRAAIQQYRDAHVHRFRFPVYPRFLPESVSALTGSNP